MKKLYLVLILSIYVISNYAHGPVQTLSFTENKGQLHKKVKYHCKLHVGDLYLESNAFTFDMYSAEELDYYYNLSHKRKETEVKDNDILNKHSYQMYFNNSNPNPKITKEGKVEGYKNYFIGNDESKWATNVNSYTSIKYHNLYNNIDLNIYTSISQVKYDFIVKKGGEANDISIYYYGVESLKINEKGYLLVKLSNGEVKESKPIAFQNINGSQVSVECKFKIEGNNVSFYFPNGYNHSEDLIIDPVLVFSSLTGSTSDNWGFTATYDSQGNVYGGGISFASGYPTTAGAYQTTFGGTRDIAISKFTANGNTLLYSTYVGGSGADVTHSLVNDSQDNLIIMGSTSSSDYPVSAGCFDATFNGGANFTGSNGVPYNLGADAIITKLNPTGTALIGSTYIGGTANDGINQSISTNYSDEARGEVVVDELDNIYVTCSSRSNDFPTTSGSHSTTNFGNQDAVVFKMNPTLTTLDWSTYFGGSGNDAGYSIRLAPNGNIYICGGTASNNIGTTTGVVNPTYGGGNYDGYIASFNGNNGMLLASTYLGTGSYDQAFILEVDSDGDVYTVGQTKGVYPQINAPYSINNSAQFIHKLNGTLTTTIFSMLFGDGNRTTIDISLTAFLVDNCGNIYAAGWGGATNDEGTTNGLPITGDAIKSTTDGSDFYFIVIERNATGLLYGSYFGSNTIAEHVDGGTSRFDKNGTIYQAACAGCGGSQTFPTTPGVWSTSNGSSNCNLGVIKIELDFQGISANAVIPDDIILCGAPFNVDFEGNNPAPPHAFWDFGDGNTSLLTNPTHTFADSGTYQIMYVAIDSTTCNISDTSFFDVTLIRPEVFDAQFDIPTVDPCDGIDSLLVSLEFTGTGADSLVWNMGNGDIFSDSISLDYYYTSQGVFTITMIAYDFVCNNSDTITEIVDYTTSFSQANAVAPPDTSFCGPPPYDMDFTTNSTTPHHFWDFGDGTGTSTLANPSYTYNNPGNYDIMYVAIDSSTCNIADTVYFNVDITQAEELSATFDLPTVEPCSSPDSLLVSLAFTGTGADSLSWNMGNGTTFTDVNTVDYYYTSQGSYVITMQAWDFYCNNFAEITDTVDFIISYSEATADVPEDIFLCTSPLNVDFATTSSTPNHFWDFGDGVGTSTQPNVTYTYNAVGDYTVMYVAIDSSTCNIADTVYFDVTLAQAETFSATIDFVPPPPCGGDSMLVELAFTGSGADSLIWNMGNGDIFNGNNVVYYYTVPGIYNVSLTAYDNLCNNVETISNEVTFAGNVTSDAEVPNVFSPNGDGQNDILKIMNIDPNADFSMKIYNRWGRIVFESQSNGQFWDGSSRLGGEASAGVYFYEVIYRDICTDEDKLKTGYVHLMRQ